MTVTCRWMAAAFFAVAALTINSASAADDQPEKKRDDKRQDRRGERRSEQPQAQPAARPANPERRAPPAAVQSPQQQPQQQRRTQEQDRRPRMDSRPQSAPVDRAPARVQPSAPAQDRRVDRPSAPAQRNVDVYHRPGGDRTVTRTSMGSRTVVVARPDRTVIVAHAPGRGYVQRPVVISNNTYVQRTYVRNNVVMTRMYRPYTYRGVSFAVYTPVRYYPPSFYAWSYSPWRTPVRYSWGWYGDPWYGYYRGYFSPYPVYTSPALWLTDYLIATTLEEAYQERMAERRVAAAAYGQGTVPLSPEVKQAISMEVQQQIQYERNMATDQGQMAAANGLPPSLADNRRHLFVVDRPLDVPNLSMGGQTCSITEGDVLEMGGAAPYNADAANVQVASAQVGSCALGSTVSVYLADLSEMQNHLRQTVDQGMEELRAKQGQGGLPALPANVAAAPTPASFASQLPPADPNAAAELQQQYADPPADAANAPAPSSNGVVSVYGGPAPTPTISLGQSIDQVVGILGQPKSIADLGSKKVYMFQDLKVTFVDGRVTDVQ